MKRIVPFLATLLLLAGCGAQPEKSAYRRVITEEVATMMEEESGEQCPVAALRRL